MAKITYIESNGKEHVLNVKNKTSAMDGAVRNGVPGIVAECGGSCSCATCHVYVDPAWIGKVGPPSQMEAELLEGVPVLEAGSRLSCQINVSDALDGLILRIPVSQY